MKKQPFRYVLNYILKIKKVVPLTAEGAISGETFQVIDSIGKKYKLRYCNSLSKAREIERNVNLLPSAFPKFHGREGKFLLFDWIEGSKITLPASLDVCYQVGKLMGEAHALEDIDLKKTADQYFANRINFLKKARAFTIEEFTKIELKYRQLKEKLKVDIILELHDVHTGNLIIDKMRKVFFVDEEGFGHMVKGLGLVKPIVREKKWIKTPEQQEAFWKGYHEHYSSDYFDRDYKIFVLLLQLIRNIGTKINTQQNYDSEKKQLLKLL